MAKVLLLGGLGAAKGVPKASFRIWRGGRKRTDTIHYEEAEHAWLPHVVKFSGGRSSGLMLLMLLESRALLAERGDVVLFTNTSAEHPATYDFIRKMKHVSEKEGIPFLLAEMQTYETVADGAWMRRKSYRLVNEHPLSADNPQGYSHRGEVFEEMIADKGMLPSMHTRICTVEMKMRVTRDFLSDWLAAARGLPALGHAGKRPRSDVAQLYSRYVMSGGTMTRREFENRWKFLDKRPIRRPAQRFSDFTRAQLRDTPNPAICGSVFGGKASLLGPDAAGFLTLLGFRRCETDRYMRMVARNSGQETPGHNTHPPGEYSYAPLYSCGIRSEDVFDFWKRQPKRIRPMLPTDLNLSNCVFCFLKGKNSLKRLQREKSKFERTLPADLRTECRKYNSPNSLTWWTRIENDYARTANTTTNGSKRSFGMFGLTSLSYASLSAKGRANGNGSKPADAGTGDGDTDDMSLTCDCTD